jgi:hypothetical protein
VADNDDIILTCPCCSATLRVDDAGELEVVAELAANERKAATGLVVEEATPGWQLQNYFFNSQREKVKYRPEQLGTLPCIAEAIEEVARKSGECTSHSPESLTYEEPVSAPVSEEELTDAANLLAANNTDLKSRNLN